MKDECLHLVTGKLAAKALEEVVSGLSTEIGFTYSIDVLPITVAALMTPDWIAKHIQPPETATIILLPGYCAGDCSKLEATVGRPVMAGPKDLRELPQFLGSASLGPPADYGQYAIEIIAEINHAPRLSLAEILSEARALAAAGANLIDIGCEPGDPWREVDTCVRALVDEGCRVSIDSLNLTEIAAATGAGAELVLSVNQSNRHAASDWGCEVVAIPDDTRELESLYETAEFLAAHGVRYRLDPIIEPVGFGFAQSLRRYYECRDRCPDAPMMMGIGNVTELSACDPAGINFLLLAICEELQIHSVLTTQVINWARMAVRECDVARRMVHYAISKRCLPKNIDDQLVMLRDARLFDQGAAAIEQLADEIRDRNIRLYAERGELHLLTRGLRLADHNAFNLLAQLEQAQARGELAELSTSHAFYLGYELCKATIALQLGKQYRQDESLNWGLAHPPHREFGEER